MLFFHRALCPFTPKPSQQQNHVFFNFVFQSQARHSHQLQPPAPASTLFLSLLLAKPLLLLCFKAQAKFDKEQHIVEQLRAGKTTLEVYGFNELIEKLKKI